MVSPSATPFRKWVAAQASDFATVPEQVRLPSGTFVLLLAADATGVPDRVLHDCAVHLLRAGARYVCAWGPDCERVHFAFDMAAREVGLNHDDAVVMTTSHEDEPLREAVWYAANPAYPDEAYQEAGDCVVAVSIGNDDWAAEIREYLEAGTPLEDEP